MNKKSLNAVNLLDSLKAMCDNVITEEEFSEYSGVEIEVIQIVMPITPTGESNEQYE